MRQDDVLIKWTGSKRLQAPFIIQHFPKVISTYYDPFLGGGSILHVLLNTPIEVKQVVCSDANHHLMALWEAVQKRPSELIDYYKSQWPLDKAKFHAIRNAFNEESDPRLFLCIIRSCRNGLIRFNRKGSFTSAFHEKRSGVSPDHLQNVMCHWNQLIRGVQFKHCDYSTIAAAPDDFIYLDPPYESKTKECFYHGQFDYDKFWDWLRQQPCSYVLSLKGDTIVPQDLYDCKQEVPAGFHRLNRTEKTSVIDALYIRRRTS